jgi:DNA-directed RNA polymerase specialized sigma24 family protein
MGAAGIQKASSHGAAAAFQTTHWSMVLAAETDAAEASHALERLCAAYWFPIYTYLRRNDFSRHDAQDLTQSFLAHLLANQRLRTIRPEKGRFRSFLLGSLKNFLANEWHKENAAKRGKQFIHISIDEDSTEDRFNREPCHELTPDKAFERSWALLLLDSVLAELRAEFTSEGKAPLFDAIQIYLSGDKGAVSYDEMASRLDLRPGALKMSVLRMRRRFGEILRSEIANTVSRPDEIDEEIRCLFAAVGS